MYCLSGTIVPISYRLDCLAVSAYLRRIRKVVEQQAYYTLDGECLR